MEIPSEFWNLSDIVLIVAFAFCAFYMIIKAILTYKEKRKGENGQSNKSDSTKELLLELKLTNENHLSHIVEAINCGNKEVVKAINDNGQKQIEILGRILGRLDR